MALIFVTFSLAMIFLLRCHCRDSCWCVDSGLGGCKCCLCVQEEIYLEEQVVLVVVVVVVVVVVM